MKKQLLFAAALLTSMGAAAAPFLHSDTPTGSVALTDGQFHSYEMNVLDSGTITDLNVEFTLNYIINSNAIMSAALSHGGVVVDLTGVPTFPAPSPINANGTYSYDDEPGAITPAAALSAFDGMDINGTWTLTLVNNGGFTVAEIELSPWSISGELADAASGVSSPAALWLLAPGLLGVIGLQGWRRRRS